MDQQDIKKYLRRSLGILPVAAMTVFPPTAQAQAWDEEDDTTIYSVVINHEEQYSIWPADREVPLGWKATGETCLRQDCLAHIEEVWTDMRPLSLRKHITETNAAVQFKVVVNKEEALAVWPLEQAVKDGWKDTGKIGTKAACEAYVRRAKAHE